MHEREYEVRDFRSGQIVGKGSVYAEDGKTLNTLAVNAGAGVAELFDLDPLTSVKAWKPGKADKAVKPAAKGRVKDGEPPYKAVPAV